MNIEYPKAVVFKCDNCGICCGDTEQKTRHILLTAKDAQRIAQYTRQPILKFAYSVKGKSPYVYEMNKNAVTKKCVFHKNNQCSIYVHRPLICKFYPFQLTTDNEKYTFKITSECPAVYSLDTLSEGEILGERYFKQLLKVAFEELSSEDVAAASR
ncbi:MAG: YkgJ family cysteine cluster protein [Candidatus Bathyarchaeota archaeon]|nr:YkgJ family cysteine cluster protein [Candidatus Bathyarchaeota archaeon]